MIQNGMKKKDFMAMEWNSNIYYYDDENNIYPTRYEALKSKKQCKFYFYDKEFSKRSYNNPNSMYAFIKI